MSNFHAYQPYKIGHEQANAIRLFPLSAVADYGCPRRAGPGRAPS
jgi:hypothetical protein